MRRWYYRKVMGLPEPSTAAQQAGTDGHSQIEHYLTTGEDVLGSVARAGREFMPARGELMIESPIEGVLDVRGVPVVGFIDCAHKRREYVKEDGEIAHDPAGRIEVIDWKFTGSVARFEGATRKDVDTVPMALYGAWAVRHARAEWIRLSHVYFLTKGRPRARKVSLLVLPADIDKRLERIGTVVDGMKSAALAKSAEDVPCNPGACEAFGKRNPCTYRLRCSGYQSKTMDEVFGRQTSNALIQAWEQHLGTEPSKEEPVDFLSELEQLKTEEAASKPATPPVSPEAIAIVRAIESAGLGYPATANEAAAISSTVRGIPYQGWGVLAGEGWLGSKPAISGLNQMKRLVEDLVKAGRCPAPAPLPEVVLTIPAPSPVADVPALLPPDAPASNPALASEAPPAPVLAPPEPAKAKRKPKAKASIAEHLAESAIPDAETVRELLPPAAEQPVKGGLIVPGGTPPLKVREGVTRLFIDALPDESFEMFDKYVDTFAELLAKQYGAVDVRCAAPDSPLGFGKWKGALSTLVKQAPPPRGTFVLLVRSEIDEVVAAAMRTHCAEYVKGVAR